MPYDFTNMWNLKDNINKHNKNRLIDPETKLVVAGGEGIWGNWVKEVKGLRSTNL